MSSKHTNRRGAVSGASSVRDNIRQIAYGRTHANFSAFLSGGPYSGVEILAAGQQHQDNSDEANYADFAGSFSKGLNHNATTGLVDPAQYIAFKSALDTQTSNGLTQIPIPGSLAAIDSLPNKPTAGTRKRSFVNPLSGLGTDVCGLDPYDVAIPPAPPLSSDVAAKEMVELYWMAAVRDVHFANWGSNGDISAAINELNTLNNAGNPFAEHYVGGVWTKTINPTTLFRGSAPGNDVGGYVSQFLIHDIPYGTLEIKQRQRPVPTADHMKTWQQWLDVQNGQGTDFEPSPAKERFEPRVDDPQVTGSGYRYIHSLRDLTHYVRFDALHEAYFNAALIMDGMMVPLSPANPYGDLAREFTQRGFGTLGGPHILALLTEVATRALKAVWHQKWFVHRRLRPEALGARVHIYKTTNNNPHNIHGDLLNSQALSRVHQKENTWLLPQAFHEGSPMHPSYGAGHATVAGACVTILKAMFDPRHVFDSARIMRVKADGSGIEQDPNPPKNLTVGGELNKLAANIAIGRNAAGVHYRSDYTKSLALGEAVAMAMLQEQAFTFAEDISGPVWVFENFAGQVIEINAGGAISYGAYPAAPRRRLLERSLFSS
ncbi:vanadium-dependent haloperoxidase [Mesorhizobium sp.]|uniref:vanadium-dependent haloperoxidase n=1 Tax=Mesorhizobium sp. TaxID=1871066 RepID=UPI0012130C5F|nr:vanadium-dependent haloperoxidase [Mesorhizobium sp.]TIL65628.1 MAG: phosphoesterase [Mesorhizobium sp.]